MNFAKNTSSVTRPQFNVFFVENLKVQFFCSYSKVPNVTNRSIETHTCTLGESIGMNYPDAWTNGKLLYGKKHSTNNFVSHNLIKAHDFKISSCQKCYFQLNHTADLHF